MDLKLWSFIQKYQHSTIWDIAPCTTYLPVWSRICSFDFCERVEKLKELQNNPQLEILSQSQSCQSWWRTEQQVYQFHIQINQRIIKLPWKDWNTKAFPCQFRNILYRTCDFLVEVCNSLWSSLLWRILWTLF